ncbi:hypothetical protein FBY04_11467 [Pseudomonas sp. SJZ080]|uniref:hypothetical protein n=1 Tax=Pseudomonas sp. SJZ080 TaxID=2572888 RepID=UPI00119989AE|nr:hypothetical protein [Pseudomonas sp. SJZ080]TWC53035.1 hypothetical protein FBY04_11467 [Pseudomonas sp. SJZ080]
MQDFTFGKFKIHFQIEHGVVISNTPGRRVAWIRTKEGDDLRLDYAFEDFHLRKGHEVYVIYAASSHKEGMYPVLLRNHNLSLSFDLESSDFLYQELIPTMRGNGWILAVLLIPWPFIYLLSGQVWGGIALPLIYLMTVGKRDDKRKKRLVPELDNHIYMLDRRATARYVVTRALSRNL